MGKQTFETSDVPRFGRQWWLRSLKTLFWVALVTLLIWLYADLEVEDTMEFRATLILVTGEAERLEILSPAEQEVTFVVRGNRTSLEQFRRELSDLRSTLRYDVSEKYGQAGTYNLVTAEVVTRAGELIRRGVTVKSASPAMIPVKMDERIAVELPVELRHANARLAEANWTPRQVEVLIARSKWEELKNPGSPKPPIRTEVLDLRNEPSGETIRRSVKLRPVVEGHRVKLTETRTIDAELHIAGRTDTKTLTVSVGVRAPAKWAEDGSWAQFTLKRKDPLDWTKEIRVAGTKADLDRLRPENVDAYVDLTDEDKTTGDTWLVKEVAVRFPKGLDVHLAGAQELTVELNFKAKASP